MAKIIASKVQRLQTMHIAPGILHFYQSGDSVVNLFDLAGFDIQIGGVRGCLRWLNHLRKRTRCCPLPDCGLKNRLERLISGVLVGYDAVGVF